MDRIHDELDEIKLEAEQLRYECQAKTELYHSLRKAQAEQLAKSRQDKLEIDELARELMAKSEEIREIRQMYEEFQSNLRRKDLVLQKINSANEKLRAEYGEKILKLEGENRDLISSSNEASSRIWDLKIEELQREFETTVVEKMAMFDEASKQAENQTTVIEAKNRKITELEKEVISLRGEVKLGEKSIIRSNEEVVELEASLQTAKSEVQELKNRLREFESHSQGMLEDLIKASIDDKANLLARLEGICGKIGIFCREDVEMVSMLGRISQFFEEIRPRESWSK